MNNFSWFLCYTRVFSTSLYGKTYDVMLNKVKCGLSLSALVKTFPLSVFTHIDRIMTVDAAIRINLPINNRLYISMYSPQTVITLSYYK